MKFNTGIAKELTKSNEQKYFTSGIMENVYLKTVELKETPTGIKYISFLFGKEGYKDFEYSQYVPNKGPNDIDDSNMINKMNNQIGRFDKLLKLYYPNDADRLYETDDYIDYLKWLCDKFMSAKSDNEQKGISSLLLRLKLVYDDKGYLTLPRYLKFDFVEPMGVAESKIALLSFDQLTKVIVADQEQKVEEPTESFGKESESDNDLPF